MRDALKASLVHGAPYAERFRTIHPDGSIRLVLGIGRPLECGVESGRFAGWNFDVESTGEMAADWIQAHPKALGAEHLSLALPSGAQLEDAPHELSSEALLERASSARRIVDGSQPAKQCSSRRLRPGRTLSDGVRSS